MVGEGRCLEVPPARGSEIPPARSRQRLGNCIPFHYLHVPKLYCFADPPCPPSEPFRPSQAGRFGWPRTHAKNARNKRKTATLSVPESCGGEDVFLGLGSRHNDDKGSDTPFRTIEKCKRAARTAAAPAEPEIVASTRAAAPEAPEPEKRLVEQVCILF